MKERKEEDYKKTIGLVQITRTGGPGISVALVLGLTTLELAGDIGATLTATPRGDHAFLQSQRSFSI